MRALLSRGYSIDSIVRAIAPPTNKTYEAFAQDKKLEILTDDVGECARLHWVGPRNKDRVLLYFHGGGFSIPAGQQYFEFVYKLKKDLTRIGIDTGIAVLEYSLAPRAPFPTQLRQANAALKFLFQSGTPPSGIIIAGDSAGGNLCLQLMSHLLHPMEGIPPPPGLSEPLAGAALVSPWVAFHEKGAGSYERNDARDWVPRAFYNKFAVEVLQGVTPAIRAYVEPLETPDGWWVGGEGAVKRVLVFGGSHECIYDQILEMAEKLKRGFKESGLRVVLENGGVHEDMINRFAAGEGGRGSDYKEMVRWIEESYDTTY
ncbi:Alpha/Beta hydrolase protein [Gloeopeniophorella convolvens]|nr:Alpha/Beta hydrolase protein [Gloeopeniophorella convolvens]